MRWSRCANAVRGGDPGCRAARLEHARDERNGISGGTEPARNGRTAQDHLLHTENGLGHIKAAVEAGADEYVMKPFDRDTLESKLQRSEEHTSELQSLMRISYAVFC